MQAWLKSNKNNGRGLNVTHGEPTTVMLKTRPAPFGACSIEGHVNIPSHEIQGNHGVGHDQLDR